MCSPEQESAIVLAYVEQRDAALAELTEQRNEKRYWHERVVLLQEENAMLRRASTYAARHRKALETLIRDCLRHMDKPADEIVDPDSYELVLLDDWEHERLSLERRAQELFTT